MMHRYQRTIIPLKTLTAHRPCSGYLHVALRYPLSTSSWSSLTPASHSRISRDDVPALRLSHLSNGLRNLERVSRRGFRTSSSVSQKANDQSPPSTTPATSSSSSRAKELRENIYTIPNALTVSRILACPVLGWSIVEGNFVMATSLLAYAGITDWVRVL